MKTRTNLPDLTTEKTLDRDELAQVQGGKYCTISNAMLLQQIAPLSGNCEAFYGDVLEGTDI